MFCIKISLLFVVSFFLNGFLFASTQSLISISSNEQPLDYQSKITGNCQFDPASEINLVGGNLIDQIYFSPQIINQTSNRLQFKLGSIENLVLMIDLEIQGDLCLMKKSLILNQQHYHFISMTIEFESFLKLRSISHIDFELETSEGKRLMKTIKRHGLIGFFPLYQLSLGAALNIGTSFRPDDKSRFRTGDPTIEPVPAFLVRYGPFFINNDGAGFVFLPFKKFLGLMTFLLEGEPVESEGYFRRKRSIYMGPLIVTGPFEIHYYKDIKSRSHGEVLKLTFAHKLKLTSTYSLQIRPFVQYWDSSYMNYYFGAGPEEKAFYQAGSSFNYGIGTQLNYEHHKWSYFTSFTIKRFGEEVRESPMTTRGTDFRLIIGGLVHLF